MLRSSYPAPPRSSRSTPCGEPEPLSPSGVPTWGGAGGQSPHDVPDSLLLFVLRHQTEEIGVQFALFISGRLFNQRAGTVTPALNVSNC